VTPATSPKAFSGKKEDDFFDDAVEDASARKAALRERLHEAARKLHRAEQLAAGFAFGEGRASFDEDDAGADERKDGDKKKNGGDKNGFAALRGRLESLVASADAASAHAMDADAFQTRARAVASWFADLQTELETRFVSFGASSDLKKTKDWRRPLPLSERRRGAGGVGARVARRTRSAAASPS
jgi:hypothetical protein